MKFEIMANTTIMFRGNSMRCPQIVPVDENEKDFLEKQCKVRNIQYRILGEKVKQIEEKVVEPKIQEDVNKILEEVKPFEKKEEIKIEETEKIKPVEEIIEKPVTKKTSTKKNDSKTDKKEETKTEK